jgi:hypothetical protein
MMTEKEKTPEQLEQERKQLQFALLEKLRLVDLDIYPYRTQEKIIGKYTREQLKKALEAPELDANQKQLRNISKFLYNASSHYKRLILHFATILTLDYFLEPYGIDPEKINAKKLKKAYFDTLKIVESMNIKHEFSKVLLSVIKEGIFFGYKHQNKDSFFIQQLDSDYCKITFVEDGLYGFAFNFSYFYTYPERINMFPDEFKTIYNEKYSGKGKTKLKPNGYFWEDLSSDNTVCIKFDESTWYPIPPFIGVFESLLDISDFKDLQKAKEVIDNYKLITMKIPLNENSGHQDDYLISGDHALLFQSNVESVVPDQIGVATTPLEMDVIDFERDKVDKNKVADATQQYFSEAGVSKLLFSSDANGSIGVNLSVKTDENIAFTILRQIERWVNRFLKNINGTYNFRAVFPDVTRFNQQEMISTALTNAQSGLPVKSQLLAVSGSNPSSSTIMTFFENEVLGLTEKLIPLQSAHVQSGKDGAGAPEKKVGDLSDTGLKTRDNQGNDNKTK